VPAGEALDAVVPVFCFAAPVSGRGPHAQSAATAASHSSGGAAWDNLRRIGLRKLTVGIVQHFMKARVWSAQFVDVPSLQTIAASVPRASPFYKMAKRTQELPEVQANGAASRTQRDSRPICVRVRLAAPNPVAGLLGVPGNAPRDESPSCVSRSAFAVCILGMHFRH
jgi:hypothetical protein